MALDETNSSTYETEKRSRTYCVTGASGYLASWLVMRLLQRGCRVRATVRNPDDPLKTAYLLGLEGAPDRLQLVKADVLDQDSLALAFQGCHGVFHVAAPLPPDPAQDQGETIQANIDATLNVMRASYMSKCVKKVVITSTFYAMVQTGKQISKGDTKILELDESSWTSIEYCQNEKMQSWGYMVGKTLSEKAALDFGDEHGLDVVTILPSLVGGPFLAPSISSSMNLYFALMKGEKQDVPPWMVSLLRYMSYVHVEDVAEAHIHGMEDPRAKGRYLCSAVDATLTEVIDVVSNLLTLHGLPIPKRIPLIVDEMPTFKLNSKKLEGIGFTYKYPTLESIFHDTILFLIQRGYLKQ